MNNIISARDYLISTGAMYFTKEELKAEALINFAKLHVGAALKIASEKAQINIESFKRDGLLISTMEYSHYEEHNIDKKSILTAYPLDNIK